MQYLRLLLVVVVILVCHSIAGAETNVLYNAELLYTEMYSVNPKDFVEKELGGVVPTYYCHYPCSTQVHIVFFKKGDKTEWFWSRNSDWYQYEDKLDLTGMIVKYDKDTRQIINLGSTQIEMERAVYNEVRKAPEVGNDWYLREGTRKVLKRMKKGETD